VIYIDVDDLKVVNDRLGHSAGDKLLRSLAQGIRRKLRARNLIARLGGDEFGVLLSDTGPEIADLVVQRIRGIGEALTKKEGGPMPFSIGVVTFLDPPGSVDEILSTADRVMYTAKRNGKHMVCREIFIKGRVAEVDQYGAARPSASHLYQTQSCPIEGLVES